MKEPTVSFLYLKIFFSAVILIIILSIVYRLGSVIINSSFRSNSFSILYISKESKIISVDKKMGTVSYFSVGNIRNLVKGRNPFVSSVVLGVPINGIMYDVNQNLNPNFKDFTSLKNELRILFSFGTVYKNMNEYDVHTVMSIARNAGKDNTRVLKVNLLDEKSVKENITDNFKDSSIQDSQYTVEIANGTGINGFANSVAAVLTRLGYNVVFVHTVKGSYNDNSYVGFKFSKNQFVSSLLNFTSFIESKKTLSSSADVTIYLGSDLEAQFN